MAEYKHFKLPENLRRTRELHKDSLRFTADVLESTPTSIGSYEKEKTIMPTDQFEAFCDYYNVSADSMLGRNKELMVSIEALNPENQAFVLHTIRHLKWTQEQGKDKK